jgi:hypothetical protein
LVDERIDDRRSHRLSELNQEGNENLELWQRRSRCLPVFDRRVIFTLPLGSHSEIELEGRKMKMK